MSHDAILQFHKELMAIAALGIPMNLGFEEPQKDLAISLERIATRLKEELRDNQDPIAVISHASYLSTAYRSALATWLATGGSPVAFESVVAPETVKNQTRDLWELSLLSPLIILMISYLAMTYICTFTIPKLEALYEQTGHRPNLALVIMIAIRKSMVVWLPLVPILACATFFFRKRIFRTSSPKPKPMEIQKWGRAVDAASADQLSELLRSNLSLFAALDVICSDQPITPITSDSITPYSRACQPAIAPLMQWAISEDTTGKKARALQIVAATYRQLTRAQIKKRQNWLPPIAVGLLGGCMVLGVGLSVFWPIVGLIYDLSGSGSSQ